MTYTVSHEKLCILASECVDASRMYWNPRTRRGPNWSMREHALAYALEIITGVPQDEWLKYTRQIVSQYTNKNVANMGEELLKLVMTKDKEKSIEIDGQY